MDIGIIVTCDVDVSLNSKTHPLFMKYSNGTSTQCYAYHYISELVCAFSTIPIFHSLVLDLYVSAVLMYLSRWY